MLLQPARILTSTLTPTPTLAPWWHAHPATWPASLRASLSRPVRMRSGLRRLRASRAQRSARIARS